MISSPQSGPAINSSFPARQIVIALLLILLGGAMGFKFGQEGKIPLLPGYLQPNPQSSTQGSTRYTLTDKEAPTDFKDVKFSTFWEVWRMLEQDYMDAEKLNTEKMVNGAISGMTSALDDPYTVYLPPDDNQRSAEDLAGAFYGVGIELGYIDSILAVVAPVKGTPAERAGIKASDLILHVKDDSKGLDSDTTGWTLNEAVGHIRGAKGSKVTLTLVRKTENSTQTQPFEVTLERGEIIVPSVELTFVEQGGKRVAHLKLSRFGDRTDEEWDKAVAEILSQKNNVRGVILDMRNNPGGYFEESINIASEFIEDGVVVMQKDKYRTQEFEARGKARLADVPVDVLVNKGSASASEIVAGALRDRRDAQLIGEKTFGKGTVQDRKELSNGGGIHITIAQWLLPKGDWIHEKGIAVTHEVLDNPETQDDEVLNKAIEVI
ncbi:MAG TPA: S41 family peptidase [Vitreimonas sp.]|nr:S41 family peptidase [Vitreimonas sp.]